MVGLIQSVTKHLLDFQDELPIVSLLQSLFLMLPSNLLTNKQLPDMQTSIFDIAAILSEDLSKSKTKEMTSWIADNTPLLLRNAKIKDQIMTLLPFSDTNSWFNGLHTCSDGVVALVESQFLKPWEIVCRAKAGNEFDSTSWKQPGMLEKLNDTPFSLACFNASVVRPTVQTYDALYNHGWRPRSTASSDMLVDEDVFDVPQDTLDKMAIKVPQAKSATKQNGFKSKRHAADQQTEKKRQKKSL